MSMKKCLISAILIINLGMCSLISAQQYNSDNYLVMPHGIGTIVLTTGERNVSFVTSLALIPKFEFAVAGYLFWDDQTTQSPQHFTTSLYAKYSVWVNKENNGGLAAFLGLGNSPSYYEQTQFVDLHKNYWTAIAFTLPLFNNKLSWDLFPGAIVDIDYGEDSEVAWGFTYSTRLTINNVIPKFNIVGEIFGTEGKAFSPTEFRAGIQWIPNTYIIPSFTFGSQLNGNKGAGFEIGVMILTPPFLKKDYLKQNKLVY